MIAYCPTVSRVFLMWSAPPPFAHLPQHFHERIKLQTTLQYQRLTKASPHIVYKHTCLCSSTVCGTSWDQWLVYVHGILGVMFLGYQRCIKSFQIKIITSEQTCRFSAMCISGSDGYSVLLFTALHLGSPCGSNPPHDSPEAKQLRLFVQYSLSQDNPIVYAKRIVQRSTEKSVKH